MLIKILLRIYFNADDIEFEEELGIVSLSVKYYQIQEFQFYLFFLFSLFRDPWFHVFLERVTRNNSRVNTDEFGVQTAYF